MAINSGLMEELITRSNLWPTHQTGWATRVCGLPFFLPEQRHLSDALCAVVLVGAGIGFEAVLARGRGGLAVAEDALHGGDVAGYLVMLGGQLLGKVDDGKAWVRRRLACKGFGRRDVCVPSGRRDACVPGVDDTEVVNLAAMRDDVVLQGGIPFVGLAEDGAAFDLIDFEGAVSVLVHHIGEDKDIVIKEPSLE